jgi:hypothetical protein
MNPSFELKNLDEEETTDTLVIRNKYGRLIPFLCDEKGEPRFMLGPHCTSFTNRPHLPYSLPVLAFPPLLDDILLL